MLNLGDKLRKAASYFVVMDESQQATTPATDVGTEDSGTPRYNFSTSTDEASASFAETPNGEVSAAQAEQLLAVEKAPAGARTVEDIVRQSDGPNLDEIKVSFGDAPPPQKEDGAIDFEAVYAKAALPEPAFSAEQALEMIASLPANLPAEVKRQTAQISIGALGRATGTTTETIVADASRKIAAINAYADDTDQRTSRIVAEAESEIASLMELIEEKRALILQAQEIRERVERACVAQVDHLDDILAFFSTGLPAGANPPPLETIPQNPALVTTDPGFGPSDPSLTAAYNPPPGGFTPETGKSGGE